MSRFPFHLLLPFLAALVFALGSLCFKRAFQEGASLKRSLAQTNFAIGLAFLPLLILDHHPLQPGLLLWPIAAGTLFFVGQACNFTALKLGDVSLVTPLMGTKVIFVAWIGWQLFDFPLTTTHLLAAVLTTLGVLILGATDFRRGRRIGLTTALATGSSLAFAMTDTVIQRAAAAMGSLNLLACLFATLGLESALIWPWLGRGEPHLPRGARRWLGLAIALTALQGLLITLSIGLWQDATGVNVVYSLRGLWGIVLVGWAGRWFGNRERHDTGARTLGIRLTGALLIVIAVVLTVAATHRP